MKKEELEGRLIDFSVSVSIICQSIKRSALGRNLSQQLIRSATSSALNYGEAQGAESRKDFVHKLRISLKELRETNVSLRIIEKAAISNQKELLHKTVGECNQLIAIFVTSVRTAENNNK